MPHQPVPAAPRRPHRPILVADLMCGAGGTSSGAKKALSALGLSIALTCVNHWPTAIATHRLNHPDARHFCQDVASIRPTEAVPEGYLDLLLASPTCTFHSRARGAKPTSDQQRSDPWHIITWLTELRVKRLLVENVPEYVQWGPVDRRSGRPIRSRQGEYFHAWISAIRALGFRVEWRVVNCADHGDPTTRKRFFLQARSDHEPITWPEPTHTRNGETTLFACTRPWRTAREIIDWSLEGKSIFDRPKPLAIKTLLRLFNGAVKNHWPDAYLVILRRHMESLPISAPLPALTAGGNHIGLAQPSLTPFLLSQAAGGAARSVDLPTPTIVGKGAVSLSEPILLSLTGGDKPKPARTIREPLWTTTTHNGVALAEPALIQMNGRSSATTIDHPTPGLTTASHLGLAQPIAQPFLLPQRASGQGRGHRILALGQPLPTITTVARIAFVEPTATLIDGDETVAIADDPTLARYAAQGRLVTIDGRLHLLDIRFRMLQPHELASAMGFNDDQPYQFTGNKTDVTRQIGNAVPVNTAAALIGAMFKPRSSRRPSLAAAE